MNIRVDFERRCSGIYNGKWIRYCTPASAASCQRKVILAYDITNDSGKGDIIASLQSNFESVQQSKHSSTMASRRKEDNRGSRDWDMSALDDPLSQRSRGSKKVRAELQRGTPIPNHQSRTSFAGMHEADLIVQQRCCKLSRDYQIRDCTFMFNLHAFSSCSPLARGKIIKCFEKSIRPRLLFHKAEIPHASSRIQHHPTVRSCS